MGEYTLTAYARMCTRDIIMKRFGKWKCGGPLGHETDAGARKFRRRAAFGPAQWPLPPTETRATAHLSGKPEKN